MSAADEDGFDEVLHRLCAAADSEHVECDGADGADCGECVRPSVDASAERGEEYEELARDDEQVDGGGPRPGAGPVEAVVGGASQAR
ncbi:hypothetical protein GCM10019016_010700 [Streptomyces prasinosporus]|uniref:FxLD family lantipeptide n=1 Tax=Streptomyces prasinosporus TaxID=68256 RepID=A0ABP6TFH2_9ACTN|nr:hypothetical protein GCM10010332_73740 [Streptomyces albogriseolus]